MPHMHQAFPLDKLDYRALLKWELEARQRKNPAYSLRGFAAFVGVSAAYLSQVMAKKRTLSDDAALNISKKLRWPLKQRKLFLNLVRYQRSPSPEHRELLLQQADSLAELNFRELQREQFEIVAEWQHFALTELTQLTEFSANPSWIAKRLGISRLQAKEAVERLLKVGLLSKVDGKLKKIEAFYRIQDTPLEAIRAFHRSHLKKAALALDGQEFAARDISGATMAFSREKLTEVRQLIREFQEKLDAFSEAPSANSVYHLAVQFYRLDKDTK